MDGDRLKESRQPFLSVTLEGQGTSTVFSKRQGHNLRRGLFLRSRSAQEVTPASSLEDLCVSDPPSLPFSSRKGVRS